MVVVLRTGVVHGPGDGGTGVSDVVHFNVHRAPVTRCTERLSFPICVQAQRPLTSVKSFHWLYWPLDWTQDNAWLA